MLKRTGLLLSLSVFALTLGIFGTGKLFAVTPLRPAIGITATYYGELITHPGFTVGVDLPIITGRYVQLITQFNVGGYAHIRNSLHAFTNIDLGLRVTSMKGFTFEILLGGGYLHKWLIGTIYERDAGGTIVQGRNPGYPNLLVDFSLGVGYDFGRIRREQEGGVPLSWFLRFTVTGTYPYYGYMMPAGVVQTGIIYRLPGHTKDR